MRALRACVLFVLPAMLVASALAEGSNEEARYAVAMELWVDGELRGTPAVVTVAGRPASVAVADASEGDGWKIELRVEPPVVSEGAPVGAIWLELSVHERRDGDWEVLADSLLGVPEGRSATMSVVAP